ncbi:MAG: DUF58 domain-containing protein [bacterium]
MNVLRQRIKSLQIVTLNKVYTLFLGNYRSAFKGQGIEFEDLREYQPGDNVKDIDWNTTAKTGRVHIRKFVETRELKILFLVDVSASMRWSLAVQNLKEKIVLDSIYLLSQAALTNHDLISTMVFADQIQKELPFKSSRAQIISVLKTVHREFQNQENQKSDLKQVLRHLMQHRQKRLVWFLFTDYIAADDQELEQLLGAFNRYNDLIIVLENEDITALKNFDSVVELQDVESNQVMKLDPADPKLIQRINNDFQKYQEALRQSLVPKGISLLWLDHNNDVLLEFSKLFHLRKKRKSY